MSTENEPTASQVDAIVLPPHRIVSAGLVAIAAMGGLDVIPNVASDRNDQPIRGHVCGWDNGRGPKRVHRNLQCPCGSGAKAKKCCLKGR